MATRNKGSLEWVDGRALYCALWQIDDVTVYLLNQADEVLNPQNEMSLANRIKIILRHGAYDGNGSRVGEETYTAELKLIERKRFRIQSTISYNLSSKIVFPHMIKLGDCDFPENDEYTVDDAIEYLENNDINIQREGCKTDQDIMSLAYDQGMGENDYSPPDEDYIYQEIERVIEDAICRMPDYKFENGAWYLGEDYKWTKDQLNNPL